MELIWLGLAGGYIYSVVVCFQKGKKVFGWLGVGAIIVPLAPILIWFPLVGSLRRAKPDSRWVEAPNVMAPKPPTAITSAAGGADETRIVKAFLDRAVRAGAVTSDVRKSLLHFLHQPDLTGQVRAARTPVADPRPEPAVPPIPVPAAPPPRPPAPVRLPAAVPQASRKPPPKREPSQLAVQVRKAWDEVSSEMAVHGFSYLGVLLTFVGVLGFLLFAFEDMPDQQQPVVELFIAVVFFSWSWVLHRQQAHNVAKAMELLGGMILPLVVFASLVDDTPPDFTGSALVVMLTASSLVLAYVYALVARRWPTTTLRFLVLPLVWLSAMAVGFVFKTDEVLEGPAITRLVAIQPALAAGAIALSVMPAIRARLAERSIPVVVPAAIAAPLAYLLAIALSAGQPGLMSLAATLAGLATLVSLHLLADHFDQLPAARLATPVILAGAIFPVVPQSGVGWAGLVGVGAYLMLLEWWARHSPVDQPAWLLSGVGLVVALGMTTQEPGAAAAGFGVALAWVQWRRVTGLPSPFADLRLVLTVGTIFTPFGFGWALWNLLDPDAALLIMAGLVAAIAVLARPRASADAFWSAWPAGFALVIGAIAATRAITTSPATGTSLDLLPVATLLVVAATFASGRDWFEPRFWLTSTILATDLFIVFDGSFASSAVQGVTWAGLGITLVAASVLLRHARWDHAAAVGHILGTAAFGVPTGPGATATMLSLWSVGWLLSLVATVHNRASVTRLLERTISDRAGLHPSRTSAIAWIAPALFVVSFPIAMLASLNLWEPFATNRSWTGVSLASLAVLFAGSTRMLARAAPTRRVLSYGAVVAVVLGAAIAAPVPWPTILAAAASIAVALTLAADVRHVAASWFAWTMSAVLVTLLAERVGVAPHHLYLVVLTWGVAAFVGGLIADDVIAGRRSPGMGLRVGWTRFPVLLGALTVPAALGPNFALGSTVAIWSALGAAAGYGAVSWLLKSPLPTLPAYALGTFGILLLLPVSVTEEPAWLTLAAAVLLGAHLISRAAAGKQPRFDIWSAWDMPPLLAAHGAGLLALALAVPDMRPGPWIMAGGLSAIVAITRRNRLWLDAGHVLVLVGLSFVSLGALAAGLALTSGRAFVEAYRAHGVHRLLSHIVAVVAAAAAWALLVVWAEWDLARAVSNTALMGGGGGLVGAGLARVGLIQRDSAIAWSSWAVSGVGTATLAGFAAEQVGESTGVADPWLALGLALLAAAAHLLGRVLGEPIRLAAIPLAGLAWLALMVAVSWSPEAVVIVTAIVGGTVSLVAVEWHRLIDRASDEDVLVIGWAALGALFVVVAALAATNLELKRVWASAIAPGSAMMVLAAVRGAARLPIGGLRESSAVGLLAPLTALAYGLGGSGGLLTALTLSVAVVGAAMLVRVGPNASTPWVRPIEWLVIAANLEAIAISVALLPATETITAVLLTSGVQAALVGLARREPELVALSPPLLAVAVVLLVADIATGSVQWYTLPLALVVLAEVEIVRLMRPEAGASVTESLQLIEWVGISLAVLPAAVEIFVRSLAAAGILLLVSVGLMLWAIVTRLRRRAIAAAGVAAGSSVLVVSAALAGQAPDSAVLWIIAAGLGFSVMAVAGVFEAGQSRRGRVVGKLDELMGDWQ